MSKLKWACVGVDFAPGCETQKILLGLYKSAETSGLYQFQE